MYWWLWLIVAVLWLWVCGTLAYAWRRKRLGGFWALSAGGAWTLAGWVVLLFAAPYWYALYCVFIQPGWMWRL